jgi:hypothetical protein
MLGWLVVGLAVAVPALAQYGHPLKGTWSGDWGPTKENRTRVLVELHWDGKAITGAINPGPNALPLQKATLDPSNWRVHLEAESKPATGQPVRTVVDGTLANIGAYSRVITGTWTEGAKKGDFRIVRN